MTGMRVAIVGFGRMGTRLCDAATAAGQEVVALLDSAAEPWGLAQRPALAGILHRDAAAFFAVPADILAIATTGPSHCPLVLRGLDAGIRRFVVEKPFACGVAEARRTLDAARSAGARVLVDHSRRYCPNFTRIAAGGGALAWLGPLRSFHAIVGGGSLGCAGVHFLDLANMLFGALPSSVTAQLTEPAAPNVRGAQFHDPGGAVLLTYPDGGRAYIDYSDDIGVYGGATLTFREGSLSFENEFQPWRLRARIAEHRGKPAHLNGLPQALEALPEWSEFSQAQRLEAMMRDAAAETPPVSGGDIGLESVVTYAAARWSAASGGTVRLPLPADFEDMTWPIP